MSGLTLTSRTFASVAGMNNYKDGVSRPNSISSLDGPGRKGDDSHGWNWGSFDGWFEEMGERGAKNGYHPAHFDPIPIDVIRHLFRSSDKHFRLNHRVVGEHQLHQVVAALLFYVTAELLDASAEHINPPADSPSPTAHLRNLRPAAPFGIQRGKARPEHAHRREMPMDGVQAVPRRDHVTAIQRERQGGDVRAQLVIRQTHLLGKKYRQGPVCVVLPLQSRRFVLVGEDEFEEFHELAFGAGGEVSGREDIFAGGGNAGEHRGCRGSLRGGRFLVDEERADSEEFELSEGTGGDELGEEFGAGVDELWGEGERVGTREGERGARCFIVFCR